MSSSSAAHSLPRPTYDVHDDPLRHEQSGRWPLDAFQREVGGKPGGGVALQVWLVHWPDHRRGGWKHSRHTRSADRADSSQSQQLESL